jgi:hypothetical protein
MLLQKVWDYHLARHLRDGGHSGETA